MSEQHDHDAPVGPETSCGHWKIVVMESVDCRTLDNLISFCQSNLSTVGRIKEVDCDELFYVLVEKCPPSRRG